MPLSRVSVTILMSILKELNAGATVKTVCRRHHVSPQTVYRWRNRLRAQGAGSFERLQRLENENRQLKRKVAELSMDYNALRTALITQAKVEC
jgi:putative transposase